MGKCCICGKETYNDKDIVCDVCKPVYEGQDYLSVLDAVIHDRVTVERGREILQQLSVIRQREREAELRQTQEELRQRYSDDCTYGIN